jgi:hypothetical protein
MTQTDFESSGALTQANTIFLIHVFKSKSSGLNSSTFLFFDGTEFSVVRFASRWLGYGEDRHAYQSIAARSRNDIMVTPPRSRHAVRPARIQ